MVKYCHHCGNEIKDNEKFCSKCGKRAINLNPDYVMDDFEEAQTDFNSPKTPDNNSNANKDKSTKINKKSKSKPRSKPRSEPKSNNLMIIIITICILLIVLVIFYGLGSDKLNDNFGEYLDLDDNDTVIVENQVPHYTIDIENGVYLYGEGQSKMIDAKYSEIESYENFTVSGYEAYEIELDNGSWYIVTIFKVDYKESPDWVYNSDVDEDGNPYIFFNHEGEYHGYFIYIPNSSDNFTYQNSEFLTSIFHHNN